MKFKFYHRGATERVLPYETCMTVVASLQDGGADLENTLAVRNIPKTQGLSAAAVPAKVAAAATALHKYAEESQHFILYWAPSVTDWVVTTSSDTYTSLEARSPDGGVHMVLDGTTDSTKVRIHLPKGRAGIRLIVADQLRRDPIGLANIVRKALTIIEQGDFATI